MNHWYAKELSELTQVSVRTLHHYDRIDLLKPSVRQSNGYRLYSETDLAKLQQIIALKFFGFQLAQIKKLLTSPVNVLEHFNLQEQLLQDKIKNLIEASLVLKRINSECSSETAISWEKIIEIIKVYRMTEQLENTWVRDALSTEELKQYAEFENNLKKHSSPEVKNDFENKWFSLIEELKQNNQQDPTSDLGISIGKKCMALINGLYGKENANLRSSLWEKGFKEGKNQGEHGLTPALVTWLDKAIDAYWRHRIHSTLAPKDNQFSPKLLNQWNKLMEEIYGDSTESKQAILSLVIEDDLISQEAKNWLKNIFSL
jgi:DNA-binding transcriptional MerR regulator